MERAGAGSAARAANVFLSHVSQGGVREDSRPCGDFTVQSARRFSMSLERSLTSRRRPAFRTLGSLNTEEGKFRWAENVCSVNRRTVLVSGVACIAEAISRPASAQVKSLRVAITPDDSSAVSLYAKDMGFFSDAGLDVEVTVLSNGGSILAAVMGGTFDVASTALISVTVAVAKGLPLRVVAPEAIYDGTVPQVALVVPIDSTVRFAKDLEGKTIATNQIQSISSLSVNLWMQKHGADPTRIQWIEMPRSEMQEALVQGRIDGATLTEPFLSMSRSVARIVAAPYSAVAPRFVTVGLTATETWVTSDRDIARRFVGAIRRTAAWANAHPSQSGAILAKYSKMSPSMIAQMGRVHYATELVPSQIQPCIDLAAKGKLIASPFPAGHLILVV